MMQQYLVRCALERQMSNMCLRVKGATVLIILKSTCYFILLHIVHELLVLVSPRSVVYLELYWFSIAEATGRYTKMCVLSNHLPIWNHCRFKHQLSFI